MRIDYNVKSCVFPNFYFHILLPLRATPLRRMAVMALFMSSSLVMAELTFTTSKSTGTQLNLLTPKKTIGI